jgi:cell division protein FtsW
MKTATTVLLLSVLGLLSLGIVTLVSASTGNPQANFLTKQPLWCGLGLVACGLAAASDYRWLRRLAWPIFALAVVLLCLVWVPNLGLRVKGATRWIGFPGFTFQPSEFAKLAIIIALAWYCERYQRRMEQVRWGVLAPGAFSAVVFALVFLEPDVGTTLLLAAITSVMLLIAGLPWKYFLPPFLAGLIGLGTFIALDPMRSDRIYSWLHLEETKHDKGLQVYQSIVALGSGGLSGVGLGEGRQKLGFVPENHNDFIFSILGEELGLVATLAVLAGFLLILACGVYIAFRAADPFGMFLASGITFLIALQAVINVAVVTNALPNKGLPLPFISAGGSNLVVMLAGVGLLMSIGRRAAAAPLLPRNPFHQPDLELGNAS